MPEQALAEMTTTDRLEATSQGYSPDMSFRALKLEAEYASRGYHLTPKENLMGIPLIVTGVTFREGFVRNGRVGDYVSIEAIVADSTTLAQLIEKGRLDFNVVKIYPNEPVVFNDGGTGVRRQITEMLHSHGIVKVGAPVDTTDSHEQDMKSVFDRPHQFWEEGSELAADGITSNSDGEPIRWWYPTGLTVSNYQWQGQDAETWYFG